MKKADEYDKIYKEASAVFESQAEQSLKDFVKSDTRKGLALDIGAGQGRNAFFLAKNGFETDAVDPSAVAVEFMNKNNNYENLKVYQSDFKDFKINKKYDLILIFGLIQILSYDECLLLAKKAVSLSKKGTYVLLTSFCEKDDSFKFYKKRFKEYRKNYFINNKNKQRSFPSIKEIVELFSGFKIVQQKEYTSPIHRHGNNPPEKHEMIELVLKYF